MVLPEEVANCDKYGLSFLHQVFEVSGYSMSWHVPEITKKHEHRIQLLLIT